MSVSLRSERGLPDRKRREMQSGVIALFLVVVTAAPGWTIAAQRVPRQRPGSSRQASDPTSARYALGAIRRVLDEQVAAWNRGDLEGFMNGYWKSDHLTFFSGGTSLRGWQATLDRYRRTYQSEGREMGQLAFTDLQIEMLGPRAAYVTGRFLLRTSTGQSSGLFTLVFRQTSQGWKIIHDHTSAAP